MSTQQRLPVNYADMVKNSKLVLLGESSHAIPHYKVELIRALKALKALGFTHFAMEMLPISLKEKIDLYNRTGRGKDSLINHFKAYWSNVDVNYYQDISTTAKSLGMVIVPLDIPYEQFDLYPDECSVESLKNKTCKDLHIVRNESWAKTLVTLVNRGNKVVAFMSKWHVVRRSKYDIGVRSLVRQMNSNAVAIKISGGLYCLSPTECDDRTDETDSFFNQRYYTKSAREFVKEIEFSNYTIHLPEVEDSRAM
ncbi:hypothetical protein [Photobacterium nomapromontoriensis]|uniref:hypothetical protein n=1 Tax=Photobacterium nomapromontoriensis TaxID=2910237 RepID=UPI003D1130E6